MSSASMTKIFCVANKHFMRFAVDRVNRDWRYKIVFRLNDMTQWPKLLRTSIFQWNNVCRNCGSKNGEIKLNSKAGFTSVRFCNYEGTYIMCTKVFVFSLMREEKNEITSLIEDLNFEWGLFCGSKETSPFWR